MLIDHFKVRQGCLNALAVLQVDECPGRSDAIGKFGKPIIQQFYTSRLALVGCAYDPDALP